MTERAGDDGAWPRIGDYAFISDCHSAALVSTLASIDWYCAPRLDAPSMFARVLDRDRGGCCAVEVLGEPDLAGERRYVERSMVLETTLRGERGTLVVTDCLAMTAGGDRAPRNQIIRQLRCTSGEVELEVRVAPRFEYASILPWLRKVGDHRHAAVGGTDGLQIWSDVELSIVQTHDLVGRARLSEGDERYVSLTYIEPEDVGSPAEAPAAPDGLSAADLRERIDETRAWWQGWCDRRDGHPDLDADLLRSALVLKSLQHARTGAVAAAPTAGLPEVLGGGWNWDYRYTWIRDSWLMVRSLADLGFRVEADRFRRFVERSAAGSADEVQVLYGIDGRHRIDEFTLDHLEGHRGSRPVRIGNAAMAQRQLDVYGYLLELTWQSSEYGAELDRDYWDFIVTVVDAICRDWERPDHGIWELRGEPRHYVYSKAMCWVGLDLGVQLADRFGHSSVDLDRWRGNRDQVRERIESEGVDPTRGCLVETFGGDTLDASALLLLASTDFLSPDDPRFAATVDAIIGELGETGLIRRFRHEDDSAGEGAFVACTFWLVECLCRLGRHEDATTWFDRAVRTANDLGLFAEEYDVGRCELLGNFPQGLSHLAHISACLSLKAAASVDRPG